MHHWEQVGQIMTEAKTDDEDAMQPRVSRVSFFLKHPKEKNRSSHLAVAHLGPWDGQTPGKCKR